MVRPRRRRHLGWILLGILLLAIGGVTLLVSIAGEQVMAEVTAVGLSNPSEHEYKIEYRFVTRDGKVLVGTETRSNVLDITRLPDVGDTITVRYLPFLPFFSLPAGSQMGGVVALGLALLGVVLLVVGVRGR